MMNVWPEMSCPPFHIALMPFLEASEDEEEKSAGWVVEERGVRVRQYSSSMGDWEGLVLGTHTAPVAVRIRSERGGPKNQFANRSQTLVAKR